LTIPSRHLGDTRSGNKICLYDTENLDHIGSKTADFDEKDHFDAPCLFQYFSVKAVRQYGLYSDEVKSMIFMGDYHLNCIGYAFMEKEKKLLSLATSVDLKNHGESLVRDFLRE